MYSTSRAHRIEILEAPYDPESFLAMAKGLENVPEGGERCFGCYALRLRRTADAARKYGFDYFSTTLTISPLKNADKLNEIGEKVAEEMRRSAAPGEKVPEFLPSDFKKKNGYLRSIELSKEFDLYRQNYCGCRFSRQQAFFAK
jgi:predicted adenine nucleotide alpha hydrolase (AANH) superfamily ATPase